jgi:predicted nuclease of predicted toxin-antitoxin system
MKLLFDQNLSHKLVQALADIYLDCQHVRNIGLKTADDSIIWLYAKNNGYIIVSKDSDFHQRSFVWGYPPKII